jgi:FHA domain
MGEVGLIDGNGFVLRDVLRGTIEAEGPDAFLDWLAENPVLWTLKLFGEGQDSAESATTVEGSLSKSKLGMYQDYAGRVALLRSEPHLTTSVRVLGRSPTCDLVIRLRTISKQHAHLQLGLDDRWSLIDRESTNHTAVNGVRLPPWTPHVLEDHDTISLGDDIELEFLLPESLLDRLQAQE